MADSQGTSFIPKRSTKKKASPVGIRKMYFLSYVSYVLFFCTLIMAAGVFFYQFTLNRQLESEKQRLVQERDSFNQSDIERIRELDFRIDAALERLNDHVSVHSLFRAFEDTTIASVRFLDFSYRRLIGGIPDVSVLAYANNFNNVLFQREVLASNPVLAGVTITEVALEGTASQDVSEQNQINSIVSFVMGAELSKESIRYEAPAVSNQNQNQNQNQTGTSSVPSQQGGSEQPNQADATQQGAQQASAEPAPEPARATSSEQSQ